MPYHTQGPVGQSAAGGLRAPRWVQVDLPQWAQVDMSAATRWVGNLARGREAQSAPGSRTTSPEVTQRGPMKKLKKAVKRFRLGGGVGGTSVENNGSESARSVSPPLSKDPWPATAERSENNTVVKLNEMEAVLRKKVAVLRAETGADGMVFESELGRLDEHETSLRSQGSGALVNDPPDGSVSSDEMLLKVKKRKVKLLETEATRLGVLSIDLQESKLIAEINALKSTLPPSHHAAKDPTTA